MTIAHQFFSYFPQFHSDSINDIAWGKGFTDWDLIRALPESQRSTFTPSRGCYDPGGPGTAMRRRGGHWIAGLDWRHCGHCGPGHHWRWWRYSGQFGGEARRSGQCHGDL